MARRLILIALMLLVLPAYAVSGQDAGDSGGNGSMMAQGMDALPDFIPPQHFNMDPYVYTYAGYRYVSYFGSGVKAGEYEYLHSSVTGGLRLHYYPMPHRLDVSFDYRNENDHDGSLDYAYRDNVRVGIRSWEMFHNLQHDRFLDAGTIDTDMSKLYGVDINNREITLRIKPLSSRHDYIYARVREYTKDGTIQQRWMQGVFAGKVAQPRDIDWVTDELTAGVSGNIYNVAELDYHFDYKVFRSKERGFLVDAILGGSRAHNYVPKTESYMHTVMLHTNQNWPVTASGTASIGRKVNRYSGTKVDFHREYGDISATPTENLLIAVKYGHERLDENTPETSEDINFTVGPPFAAIATSRDSLTTTRDKGIAAIRYMPTDNLSLLAQYELEHVKRTNDTSWDVFVPDMLATKNNTVTHKGKIGFNYRPVKHTRVRGGVEYVYNSDPAYSTDLERAIKGYIWTTWVPTPGLIVNLQYHVLRGWGNGMSEITNGAELDRRDRREERDNAGAGVTWLAMEGLAVGAHYDYIRYKVRHNMLFETTTPTLIYSYGTPYRDTSHSYTIFADYCFSFPLKLHADFGQTWSHGNFKLDDLLAGLTETLATTNLANLTDQKVEQLKGNVRVDWEIFKGWGIAGGYGINRFRDFLDKPQTDSLDGTAHFGMAMLTKKW